MIEEEAQISAEMILIVGALLVIVIAVGSYIFNISGSIAGNISEVINTARDTTINKL
ncbi:MULTISPECIES: class III signal peptide-containing protein [unclassified Methanothermobacter]|uniref:class III signal peptide-containing protein n=1 Tax=unclassified Methanothermobacter TaxID=2631116 RepID=UPI001EDBCF1F|nr:MULTISPECIES: class III signal peptide-containing protein [unclassified Methanothermobacter]MCG2828925.1 class III signal peptide-containing protein [Methanothermobacter sp. K4]MDI9615557.1 class III signal peptide-containing protein [Methanothermobacter sp.]MDI9618688.1 class III signal peptide-containing protein [Methanothermobacter sp.]